MIEDKTKHSEKEIFILSYYEDVKHYLYMFGLGDRLEDAVQDTFVEALANIQNIRYEEKTKHWLIKIAKYVGLKYLRQEKNAAVSWYDMEEYLKEADKSGEPVSESQLDDLIGLDLHGEAGDVQPVEVARVVVGAQGGEQEQEKHHAPPQDQLPVLLHEQLKVHKGAQRVDQHPQQDGGDLDQHRPVVAVVAGGGIDEEQSVAAGGQTEGQQQHVALFEKLPDGGEQGGQEVTSRGRMKQFLLF